VANAAALNFETTPSFTLTVQVRDQGGTGLTATGTVTVNLTNVNEAPSVTGFTTALAENSAAGTIVGSVTATDPDAGDTLGYAITGGNAGGAFAIDAAGQITVANPAALDFETTPAFTLTVQVQDAGGLTDTATITVSLTNANDAPSITAPGLQVTDEDTTLFFSTAGGNAIVVADIDAGANSIQVTLTSAQGTLTLSGISGLAFSAGDGSADAAMTFTGSVTDVNAALDGLAFTPAADYNGASGLQITVSDLGNTGSGGVLSASQSVGVTVLAVNDAPVLDASAPMNLTPVGQGVTDPAGDTIASILGSGGGSPLTDVDGGGALGVAVVAVDDTHGSWQYSTDGGASWVAFGSASDASAVLLDASARLRFVPAAGFWGPAGTITFRGWDETSGVNGAAGVDVSMNGGASAFSAAAASATVEVNASPIPIVPPEDPPGPILEPPPSDGVPPGSNPATDPIVAGPSAGPESPQAPVFTPAFLMASDARGASGAWLRSGAAGDAGISATARGDTVERDRRATDEAELRSNPLKAIGMQALMQALDQLGAEMGKDAALRLHEQFTMISATEGAALVASAGMLVALLRGGSLVAFALSSLPLWRQADPLAVLALSDEEREEREEELRKAEREEELRTRGLDRLLRDGEPRDAQARPRDSRRKG